MIRKDFRDRPVTALHAIINGERRFRAEQSLGAKTVRVKVFDVDKWEALEQRLNEAKLYTPEEREAAIWPLYRHYKEMGESDTSITIRIHKQTSIPLWTVQDLIKAAIVRHSDAGLQSEIIRKAKYRDIAKRKYCRKQHRRQEKRCSNGAKKAHQNTSTWLISVHS